MWYVSLVRGNMSALDTDDYSSVSYLLRYTFTKVLILRNTINKDHCIINFDRKYYSLNIDNHITNNKFDEYDCIKYLEKNNILGVVKISNLVYFLALNEYDLKFLSYIKSSKVCIRKCITDEYYLEHLKNDKYRFIFKQGTLLSIILTSPKSDIDRWLKDSYIIVPVRKIGILNICYKYNISNMKNLKGLITKMKFMHKV